MLFSQIVTALFMTDDDKNAIFLLAMVSIGILFLLPLLFVNTSSNQSQQTSEKCDICQSEEIFKYFKDPTHVNSSKIAGFCPNCGRELPLIANHDVTRVEPSTTHKECKYCNDGATIYYILYGENLQILKSRYCPKCGKKITYKN